MTTSPETDWMDHPLIRRLVHEAQTLTLSERLTLVKGLIPSIAREMSAADYAALVSELRLKGERYYEAVTHPGEGRAGREVLGERDLEGR